MRRTFRHPALLRALMLWTLLQSLVYPEISFIDGNMQNSVVDLATALVEWRRVEITGLEINSPDVALRAGRFYSGMAPGASWLAAPLYAAARVLAPHLPARLDGWIEASHARAVAAARPGAWPGNIFLTPFYKPQIVTHMLMTALFGFLAGAAAVWLIHRLARALGLGRPAALFAATLYALGTPLLFYHASYYTQSVALFLLLVTLNLLLAGRPRAGHFVAAAFCAALAGACDYPYFAYAGLALLAGLLRRHRLSPAARAALMLAGGLLPLAATLAYHQAAFGGVAKTAYAFRYRNPFPHHGGLDGIVLPSLPRLRALLFSPSEGLLFTAPALLLAAPGLARLKRLGRLRRALPRLLLCLAAVAALHFTGIPWASDTAAYGPRFFLPGLLVLALLAGAAWPARAWRRAGLALLAAAYAVNHLHMIGLDVWRLAARAPGAASPLAVHLWPVTQTYPLAQGLGLDAAWLLAAALAAFLVAFRFSRQR